ncbi:MAG TPA: transcription-repair coupling factor [Planctomycetaceae bacterium]|nr:transcription-repair coupling factor [Planctomycetaceae bacterium]
MPTAIAGNVETLQDLVACVHQWDGFDEAAAALQRGERAAVDGAWGSSCALVAAALADRRAESEGPRAATSGGAATRGTLLVVLARMADVDEFAADVAAFLGIAPAVFPAWEALPRARAVGDPVFGARLRLLEQIESADPPPVVVTSISALVQPVPSRAERDAASRTLRVGEDVGPDALMGWLVARGFDRVPALEAAGEFGLHGGILDVFPPDAIDPLRIEFFGDEIVSIRRFDVETQRKLEDLEEVRLTLVTPVPGGNGAERRGAAEDSADAVRQRGESLLDALPAGSWVALTELEELVEEGRQFLERLDNPRGFYSVDAVLARCGKFPLATIAALGVEGGEATFRVQSESIERFAGPRSEALHELAAVVRDDERVLIPCHNEGERERLAEMLAELCTTGGAPLSEQVTLCVGRVNRGFRLVRERLFVVSDHELFGRVDLRRTAPRRRSLQTRAIDSFLELREGDLVVHLMHGIGRYRGMQRLESGEQIEEHLVLEFRDAVRMLVPTSLIHLVQKYVGPARAVPRLSKLGGAGWSRRKQNVANSVRDMAADMIRLQAARESKPGIAFPPDSHYQHEFEASFPWTETDDQLAAIHAVKQDLERPRPTDRLLCGDVGYGKTEVAMRAAFKAVEAGRQVAVLVPTTVLAEQHFRTFSERMAEYPVTIEVLSRFRTKGEQRAILRRMEAGTVDIVIGTHRLVQQDVRFRDLGLLIIDEEQRFGVEAKDMLKQMRLEVDVLTMTATPIPRTLHMAVLGIRDISNLLTPPQDRVAIETRISRFDENLVRTAIVRELNRGGQVYFVHNRVYNIRSVADRVQSIVPEARIAIAHGQMPEHQLEEAMLEFVTGRVDVLVATTIIESGLDIPNANTIFINQADRYGLADLHQLRGRVGRYKHRAYCYLLLDESRPITPVASKRLKAIEEFSELGAGFRISMRDLEIRGAGNILGTEQSGHIAAVGYELYCHLLENAVRQLKNEPIREYRHVNINLPVPAWLPDDYIPAGRQKIEIYRKLSNVGSLEDLTGLAAELRDRFGPPPPEVTRLLALKELQLAALTWSIDAIRLEDGYAVFEYRSAETIGRLAKRSRRALRIVDAQHAYWPLPERSPAAEALLEGLVRLLVPESRGHVHEST